MFTIESMRGVCANNKYPPKMGEMKVKHVYKVDPCTDRRLPTQCNIVHLKVKRHAGRARNRANICIRLQFNWNNQSFADPEHRIPKINCEFNNFTSYAAWHDQP